MNRFSLVRGTTAEMLRRQQIRVLRIYLSATTFLYAVGVLFTLFPRPTGNVELANPVGGIVAVVLGVCGLIYLIRGPTKLAPAIAAAVIATPIVMAFHVLPNAQSVCLIAVMFLAMYLIAFYRTDLARLLIAAMSVSTVVALAIAPAPSAVLTYVIAVVAIVGAAESFGLVTRALVAIACTDSLTGLLNRAGWEMATADQLARARSARTTITVVTLDVDNFKAVNDQFGHQAGDQRLIDYAGKWQTLMPSGAVFARLGGDEFAFCSDGNASPSADEVASRIHAESPGASIGSATGPAATVTIPALLAEADTELYRVKRSKGSAELDPTS